MRLLLYKTWLPDDLMAILLGRNTTPPMAFAQQCKVILFYIQCHDAKFVEKFERLYDVEKTCCAVWGMDWEERIGAGFTVKDRV